MMEPTEIKSRLHPLRHLHLLNFRNLQPLLKWLYRLLLPPRRLKTTETGITETEMGITEMGTMETGTKIKAKEIKAETKTRATTTHLPLQLLPHLLLPLSLWLLLWLIPLPPQ
jgi:hypothetical protein